MTRDLMNCMKWMELYSERRWDKMVRSYYLDTNYYYNKSCWFKLVILGNYSPFENLDYHRLKSILMSKVLATYSNISILRRHKYSYTHSNVYIAMCWINIFRVSKNSLDDIDRSKGRCQRVILIYYKILNAATFISKF